jgi:hypothetical protein
MPGLIDLKPRVHFRKEVSMEQRNGASSERSPHPEQDDVTEAFWRAVDELRARNAHIDPDEILAEVTAEVEAVRQELYERDEAAKQRSR